MSDKGERSVKAKLVESSCDSGQRSGSECESDDEPVRNYVSLSDFYGGKLGDGEDDDEDEDDDYDSDDADDDDEEDEEEEESDVEQEQEEGGEATPELPRQAAPTYVDDSSGSTNAENKKRKAVELV
jgi:hypothetical protein